MKLKIPDESVFQRRKGKCRTNDTLPDALTTPPDTSMNLVMAGKMSMRMWIYVKRDQALKKICRF